MTAQGLSWLSLRELGRRLRAGKLSPVELTELCLSRLERLGPRYNAVVTLTAERALREARQAEGELRAGHVRGPLHGIPYGAKDLFSTGGGVPTGWGFAPLRAQQFAADAAVIEKLRDAGAVLVAKLSMIELAGGMRYDQPNASASGPCSNPWNPDAWSGGSSSGSAAAVAAGLVPFALGTETYGSITGPAAMCGVSGLRPGFGRVSRRGAMALAWSLDKVGPLAHSADDCGLVLEAISGHDPADSSTLRAAFRYAPRRASGRRWRVCVLRGEDRTDQAAVRDNFRAGVDALRAVADVEEGDLPPQPYQEAVLTILFAEAGAAFAHLTDNGQAEQLTAPESRTAPYALQSIPAAAYVTALRLRQRLARDLGAWISRYDAVVTPTLRRVAPPLVGCISDYFGEYRRLTITAVGNLLGWPCVIVPNGFGERGLPTSMQFVGAPGHENTLLSMARHFQQQTDWHQRRPPVD